MSQAVNAGFSRGRKVRVVGDNSRPSIAERTWREEAWASRFGVVRRASLGLIPFASCAVGVVQVSDSPARFAFSRANVCGRVCASAAIGVDHNSACVFSPVFRFPSSARDPCTFDVMGVGQLSTCFANSPPPPAFPVLSNPAMPCGVFHALAASVSVAPSCMMPVVVVSLAASFDSPMVVVGQFCVCAVNELSDGGPLFAPYAPESYFARARAFRISNASGDDPSSWVRGVFHCAATLFSASDAAP